MKKTVTISRWALTALLLFFGAWMGSGIAVAQSVTARGVVVDELGEPLIGANIAVVGEPGKGTATNIDGEFRIEVAPDAVLRVSYVSFLTQDVSIAGATMPLRIVLVEDRETLDELVVIGYGAVEKKDLTGSVTAIGSDDFKQGLISTPDQLISGKVAGVQIVSGGGSPGAGAKIRIRGGASLNASNDPLIVIDGVPLEGSTLPGAPSPLSSINPVDIESMNILKDASATAIYGSRASNGVIIITTKRGRLGQPLRVHASTRFSIATPVRFVDVLSGDEVRALVNERGNQQFIDLLGTHNTNWQEAIYRHSGLGTDNNVSISGSTSWLPYRISLGYYNEQGILMTDKMQRVSGDLSLNPRFLDGDLAINVNLKASQTRNRFADRGAISSAISMNPTRPVMSDDAIHAPFGGYWFLTSVNDDGQVIPRPLAPMNPVALLQDRDDRATVNRVIGNVAVDYQLPFLKGLRANLNVAYDYGASAGRIYVPVHSPVAYTNQEIGKGGVDQKYQQEKENKLLDFYLNYKTEIPNHSFDIMAGYSYQDWKTTVHNFPDRTAGGIEFNVPVFAVDYPQNTLVSFYGRLNYGLLGRYLLTATVRADGSSRFSPENRWGIFPSFAFAWRIKDEPFLEDADAVSDLKLRLGYGVTGQQDGISNYSYLASYALSGNQSRYLFGDKWYNMYKPLAYDANIKWEQTATSNVGLDFAFAFANHRISGSVDAYHKQTKDLLNEISIPAGANFSNRLLTNIGEIVNQGVELTLSLVPVETEDWRWTLDFNATYNQTEITKLTQVEDPGYLGVLTGGIDGGTDNSIQIHTVGQAPNSFFVYKQVYNQQGKPIEGLYADLNGDGIINDYDKYHMGKPEPDYFMGLSSSLSYKGLSLSTSLRANIGNYIYDNVSSQRGTALSVENTLGFISNGVRDLYRSGFENNRYMSDYYIYDASFLKMDNLSLSYDFGRIWEDVVAVTLGVTVQNVFTITKYKGIDPENGRGIDHQFYPVPRTYSVSLGLTF